MPNRGNGQVDWDVYHPHGRLILVILKNYFDDRSWKHRLEMFNVAFAPQLVQMGFPNGLPTNKSGDQINSQYRMAKNKPKIWDEIFEYEESSNCGHRDLYQFLYDGLAAIARQLGQPGPTATYSAHDEDEDDDAAQPDPSCTSCNAEYCDAHEYYGGRPPVEVEDFVSTLSKMPMPGRQRQAPGPVKKRKTKQKDSDEEEESDGDDDDDDDDDDNDEDGAGGEADQGEEALSEEEPDDGPEPEDSNESADKSAESGHDGGGGSDHERDASKPGWEYKSDSEDEVLGDNDAEPDEHEGPSLNSRTGLQESCVEPQPEPVNSKQPQSEPINSKQPQPNPINHQQLHNGYVTMADLELSRTTATPRYTLPPAPGSLLPDPDPAGNVVAPQQIPTAQQALDAIDRELFPGFFDWPSYDNETNVGADAELDFGTITP